MKKLILAIAFLYISINANAQYALIDARLSLLEERKEMHKELKNVSVDGKRFILIKDFEDRTERLYLSINANNATFAEVFDDKTTNETTANVFTGDVMRTNKNVLSFRFDKLEGKPVAVPITKNLLLTKRMDILYLLDINTKERWIDEVALKELKEKAKKKKK